MDLPTLDFSKFSSGSEVERDEFADALIKSFEDHGFVKLLNHGVSEKTVRNYLEGTKKLFSMPLEAKKKIMNIVGPHPQRGWSAVGAEQTSKLYPGNFNGNTDEDLLDEREFFDAGPANDTKYPNKWPSEEDCPGFQVLMEECYEILQEASLQIIAAMENGLHLATGTLVNRCIPASSEIRLNHYPKVSIETLNKGTIKRTWAHTDFGIITLLFQDTVGGLELQDRKNPRKFVPVTPVLDPAAPSEMVVNISDTFQRWTNNVIRAGVHQVNVPPSMKNKNEGTCPDRYSSIFFFKAHRDTSVGPLPEFVTKDRPASYKEITALEFQKQKTKELY